MTATPNTLRTAMNPLHLNAPMPIQPAPELIAPELAPLLAEPFASAFIDAVSVTALSGPGVSATDALRARLAQRMAATRQAEAGMVTTRRSSAPRRAIGHGVTAQALYASPQPEALRPGEPLRASLIELAPGMSFETPAQGSGVALADVALHREWLVLSGSVRLDPTGDAGCIAAAATSASAQSVSTAEPALSQRDYHVVPAGHANPRWCSDDGAVLFLRESATPAAPGDRPHTVRDAEAGWPAFVPGIQRRVLWQRDGQAALMYWAQPGAQVPTHRHGHDEECLMLQGELFLDDVLLQTGDYQLAPAGTGHRITETDTGVVIYAHGDLDLQFVG